MGDAFKSLDYEPVKDSACDTVTLERAGVTLVFPKAENIITITVADLEGKPVTLHFRPVGKVSASKPDGVSLNRRMQTVDGLECEVAILRRDGREIVGTTGFLLIPPPPIKPEKKG
jgi:hypothetical protein